MLKDLLKLSNNKTIKVKTKITRKVPINIKDYYLKKSNNKCNNNLTKKQFNRINNTLKNKIYNGLCVCCGKPIKKNIDKNNYDCIECPNGHKIHKSCKNKLEYKIVLNNFCPVCGLIVENKTCEINLDNIGGKSKKNKKSRTRRFS